MDPTARAKQVFFGYIQTQCVYAVLELGVADSLAAGPRSAADLAAEAGAAPGPLGRMLDVLVRLGLFARTDDGLYAHNDASQCLRSDHENSMADLFGFCGRESYRTFGGLKDAVKNEAPSFDDAWGQSFWKHLRANPERARMFGRAMERQSAHLLQALVKQFDFSAYPHIADIGGGKGQFFQPLARAGLEFQGTVMDLPETAPLAAGYLAEEKLDMVEFVGGDFFEGVPEGADLYVLKFVLHDWADADAVRVLKSVKRSMKPGSKLMIIELFRGGGPSPWSLLSDMIMLTTFGASERTEAEFTGLLEQAGFTLDHTANIAGAHFYALAG